MDRAADAQRAAGANEGLNPPEGGSASLCGCGAMQMLVCTRNAASPPGARKIDPRFGCRDAFVAGGVMPWLKSGLFYLKTWQTFQVRILPGDPNKQSCSDADVL
jgi:hypothetical protein